MTDLKSKTLSSIIWKFFERGGNAIVALVVQIVMARLLTPNDFGTLAIILVFINIGSVLVQSGLNTALIQAPDATDADFSTVFWMCLTISVILYICIFVGAPFVADYYSNPSLVWPLRILSILLLLSAFNSIQVARVTRDLELKKTFFATLASVIVSGTIGIVLAFMGGGLWALVVQQVIYQIVNCVVLAMQIEWRPRLVFSIGRARKLFKFGWKLLASGILNTSYQSLSSLIIGKQFSAFDLGLVSQGEKYPQAIGNLLDGSIQPVMLSAISRVQCDKRIVKGLVRRALKTSSFLIAPVMGMLALVAAPLVETLLGCQWLPAVPFMQMYCFVYALYPIHSANLQALNGVGRSDVFLKLELIKKSYGITIILITAFVFKDVYAIVAGIMISGVISTFVNAFPIQRLIGYGYLTQLRDIAPGFLLTVLSMGIAYPVSLLTFPPFVLIMLQSVIMVGSYILIAKLIRLEELSYLIATMQELISPLRLKKNPGFRTKK